jgi:hypothetical protein
LQLEALHVPFVQIPVEQSVLTLQFSPAAQVGHCTPPQSMSVSPGPCRLSLQLDARHVPVPQNPPAQSVSVPQLLATAHFGQAGPPQSTSVSAAFLTPSWHEMMPASAPARPALPRPPALWLPLVLRGAPNGTGAAFPLHVPWHWAGRTGATSGAGSA